VCKNILVQEEMRQQSMSLSSPCQIRRFAGGHSGVLRTPLRITCRIFSANVVEPRNFTATNELLSLSGYFDYIYYLFSQFAINNDKLAEVSISSFCSTSVLNLTTNSGYGV
jgi:hypothetical protein